MADLFSLLRPIQQGASQVGQLLSSFNPPPPPAQPLQKGQNVSDFKGYQQPQSPPPQVDFNGLEKFLADKGGQFGNYLSSLIPSSHHVTNYAQPSAPPQQPSPLPSLAPTPAPSAAPLLSQMPEKPQVSIPPMPSHGLGRNPELGKKYMSPEVQNAISNAAKEFNVNPQLLFDIAYSEGGFRADARNESPEGKAVGTPVGLFQFTPGTWNNDLATYAKNSKTSFKGFDPKTSQREDPVANSRAAAYLIKMGQLGRWTASHPNWGRFYSKEELSPYLSQTPGANGS